MGLDDLLKRLLIALFRRVSRADDTHQEHVVITPWTRPHAKNDSWRRDSKQRDQYRFSQPFNM